jgi:anti-sigma-K factor RskA
MVAFMMNQPNGWMGGWSGGGMWLWAVIGVAVVVLLVVVIGKLSKK